MKTAVLSDIHANIQALEAVLKDCKEQETDSFWLLGDYVDYGACPIETIRRIESLNVEYMISGNHDACLYLDSVRSSATPHGRKAYEYTKKVVLENRELFKMIEYVADRPYLYLPEHKTILVHGTPGDPYWGKFQPGEDPGYLFDAMEQQDARLMLMGHSHISFLLMKNGRRIINPGSVGQPRDGCSEASYVILDGDAVIFRRVKYDIDSAADAIRRADLPEYLRERLYKGI